MATGKTLLSIKEIQKGDFVSNFRPITCDLWCGSY